MKRLPAAAILRAACMLGVLPAPDWSLLPLLLQVAERITEKARSSSDPAVRMYARMTLGKLSRGGGNGDEIRMGILNIMRDHGIKEGNRGVSLAWSSLQILLHVALWVSPGSMQ